MAFMLPQGVSVPTGHRSCFADVVGDITNLGTGEAISSGSYAGEPAAAAFDDVPLNYWRSEAPASTNSYIGWNWSGAGATCKAIVRRVTIAQAYNDSNLTTRGDTAVLEVSDDLINWTVVANLDLTEAFAEGVGPTETFDVAEPVLAAAARIRPTALSTAGGANTWMISEIQFIENIT